MKSTEVARHLGVHKNTIINWGHWYEEFLSEPPEEGQDRIFTDEDVRVFGYVKLLSERGLKRDGVQEALKQKRETGSDFPPLHPDLLASSRQSGENVTALALRKAENQLTLKDAQIGELNVRIEELGKQLTLEQERHEKERAEWRSVSTQEKEAADQRYDALLERYLADLARLNEEKGKLQAQLGEVNLD